MDIRGLTLIPMTQTKKATRTKISGSRTFTWRTMAIITLVLMVLFLESVQSRRLRTNNDQCPEGCFCNPVNKIVYCSRRGLTAIPRSIPAGSSQLNLNGNLFSVSLVQRSNFTSLTSLEHLYLSECGIERIEVGAFADMVNLKWLDLSSNRISRIEDNTFMGLSLLHLFLNGNRNLRLSDASFTGMQTTGLYLHECTLSKLNFDVFEPLNGTLQYLWLNANELDSIDKSFVRLFGTLNHLRLGQNPLNCNCESRWLKEFYDTHGDIFSGAEVPSCLTPEKLKSKRFNEISLMDFTCVSPYFKNIDAVLENDRGVLTCRAAGDPAPTLYWIAPSGISTKYRPAKADAKLNEAVMDITDRILAGQDISGQYFCLAINQAGNMTFTFNVSMPYSTPSLPGPRPLLTTTPSRPTWQQSTPAIAIDSVYHLHSSEDQMSHEDSYNIEHDQHDKDSDYSRETDNLHRNDNVLSVDTSNNARHKSNNTIEHRRVHTEGVYTLAELIGAIVGTFAFTVLLCVLLIPVLLRKLWWDRKRHKSLEKPPLKLHEEAIYTPCIPPGPPHANHYIGKMPQHYRDYYFENSSPVINR